MYVLLILLSISYFYCLPFFTSSLLGYTELRLYDVLMMIVGVLLVVKHSDKMKEFFRKSDAGKWIYRFSLWASLTSLVTFAMAALDGNVEWVAVTAIRLFHLWGFILAYAAFYIFSKTREQCYQQLTVFIIVGVIEAILISLQSANVLPSFWGTRYSLYGSLVFSGTLGPNRAVPGHVLVLVVAVGMTFILNRKAVGVPRFLLGAVAVVLSVGALILTGSRTGWVTCIVFLMMMLTNRKYAIQMVAAFALATIALIVFAPDVLKDRATEMFDYKISSHLEQVQSDDLVENFQAIDTGRMKIWGQGLDAILTNAWVIPFGAGFNNYPILHRGPSAVNTYITLLAEVGVVGLFMYLMWIASLWKDSTRLVDTAYKLESASRTVVVPLASRPLVAAMIVSLVGGEILYIFRPTYSFLGMFLFLIAIMNHPALVFGADGIRLLQRIRKPSLIKPENTHEGPSYTTQQSGEYPR